MIEVFVDYVGSIGKVAHDEALGGMWHEVVVAYFEALYQYLLGETKEIIETLQSLYT
jgi:hypothetical protein